MSLNIYDIVIQVWNVACILQKVLLRGKSASVSENIRKVKKTLITYTWWILSITFISIWHWDYFRVMLKYNESLCSVHAHMELLKRDFLTFSPVKHFYVFIPDGTVTVDPRKTTDHHFMSFNPSFPRSISMTTAGHQMSVWNHLNSVSFMLNCSHLWVMCLQSPVALYFSQNKSIRCPF